MPRHGYTENLKNRKFSRLLVMNEEPFYSVAGYVAWRCLCECGAIRDIEARRLKSGHTKSCGCLNTYTRVLRGKLELWRLGTDALRKYDDPVISNRYTTYRGNANALNRDFELSYQEFKQLVLGKCHYCLAPPEERVYTIGNRIFRRRLNGVDRVDNDQGYVKDNVVPCCKSCNSRKNVRSVGYLLSRNAELGLGLAA
jgi:hypothetical protein